MILKSTLIGATAIAIALTSFDLRPAAAGEGGTQVNSYKQSDEISAARKRRGDDRKQEGRGRATPS